MSQSIQARRSAMSRWVESKSPPAVSSGRDDWPSTRSTLKMAYRGICKKSWNNVAWRVRDTVLCGSHDGFWPPNWLSMAGTWAIQALPSVAEPI